MARTKAETPNWDWQAAEREQNQFRETIAGLVLNSAAADFNIAHGDYFVDEDDD